MTPFGEHSEMTVHEKEPFKDNNFWHGVRVVAR